MKLTKLSLTNFRSFGETQSIDFAPVTLLFGPNSVGKSTVLMALAYVQQILEKGHCDPQYLDALGAKKIGGFRSLVNGMDLDKAIKIKLEFEPGLSISTEYDTYVETTNFCDGLLEMEDVAGGTDHVAVEFEIIWSNLFKHAYVKNYRVWLNHEYIGCTSAQGDLKQTFISELNLKHPLLTPTNHEEWIGEVEEAFDNPLSQFESTLTTLNPSSFSANPFSDSGRKFEGLEESRYKGLHTSPISISCFSGALPLLGRELNSNLEGEGLYDETWEHHDRAVTIRVLSQAFVSPLDNLKAFLCKSVCIGPLRTIPSSEYQPNPYPPQSTWVDGQAAWDVLHQLSDEDKDTDNLLSKVSGWFESEKRFNSGYSLVSRSQQSLFREEHSIYLNSLPSEQRDRLLASHSDESKVFFHDDKLNIDLYPNQLGVGISQILPVVVAAHHVKSGIVSVEQPELHIHPAFQVEVGDLFTQLDVHESRRPTFLIETHSEHLMLRLLRRIRETTDNGLSKGDIPVKPEDISVVYLEAGSEGVKTSRIDIDEDGEFVQRWPKGFFAERRKELM